MDTKELLKIVLNSLDDLKSVDALALDVHKKTSVTDWMVIVSGTSNRHVISLAENVVIKAKQAGIKPLGIEGEDVGEWVLVDLGDIVVHVMQPEIRDFYSLEKLWGVDDATQCYH